MTSHRRRTGQLQEGEFPYHVQVLERTFRLINVLAESDHELGPAELAERLSLHRSTVHRLLMILEQQRFVRRNPKEGKYALGLRLFVLGSRAAAQLNLARRAEPFLQHLVDETGETAHISVLSGTHMLSIAHVEGRSVLQMRSAVGRPSPTHCTSVGKAMISSFSDHAVDDFVARLTLKRYTRRTLATATDLKEELLISRERGFAVDDQELEMGLRCIGAPIRDCTGRVVASMSVAGPVFRVTKARLQRLARAVIAVTREMSTDLGFKDVVAASPTSNAFARRAVHGTGR